MNNELILIASLALACFSITAFRLDVETLNYQDGEMLFNQVEEKRHTDSGKVLKVPSQNGFPP